MQLIALKILPLRLRLKTPFISAHETITERLVTVVAVQADNGLWGYGELDAFETPYYTEQTQLTAQQILVEYLWQLVKRREFQQPQELFAHLQSVKGNNVAKAALDMAVWDLYAKQQKKPLAAALATSANLTWSAEVEVGISLGWQEAAQMISKAKLAQQAGYRRIKLKVKDNADLDKIAAIRSRLPQVAITVDANGRLKPTAQLAQKIDALDLSFIEDPFASQAGNLSRELQQQMDTKLCFDEPIESVNHAVMAWELQQCQVVSVKIAMIGGLTPALDLVKAQQKYGFELWCGGMLEGGVGRAANLALASLDTFAYPGDLSATNRYYQHDYTDNLQLHNGKLQVPKGNGIGVKLLPAYQELLDKQNSY